MTSLEQVKLPIEDPLSYEMREAVEEGLKTYFCFGKEEKFMEKIVFQWVRENMVLTIGCPTLTRLSRERLKDFCNKATSFYWILLGDCSNLGLKPQSSSICTH